MQLDAATYPLRSERSSASTRTAIKRISLSIQQQNKRFKPRYRMKSCCFCLSNEMPLNYVDAKCSEL